MSAHALRASPLALACALGLSVLLPTLSAAQRIEPERERVAVEIAKWSTGAAALAAGAFAFTIQNDAEDRLEALERLCVETPTSCATGSDGEYVDPALEDRYQDIRDDYRTSRWLLIGAHLLAASSVVLFIVDLPRDTTPENVPYEPPALRVGVRGDGALEAVLRYPVSNILTRSP